MKQVLPYLAAAAIAVLLGACGGGGGGGSRNNVATNNTPPPTTQSDFEAGVFSSPGLYQAMCLNPRPGTSDAQGTTEDENNWLRAWSRELYLWYDEIVDADPALYATPAYFELMKTFAVLPSGGPKDPFHFTRNTAEYQQLVNSGIQADYGADWDLLSSSPPREAIYVFIQAGTPAAIAGIKRGDRIVAINGEDFVSGSNVDVLNDALFPQAGETHEFTVMDFDGSNERTVSLTAQNITTDTVPITKVFQTPQGPVGYMFFTRHIAPAEAALIDVIEAFNAAGITELVLDLRYNSGGLLGVANQLAYMIAGPAAAQGKVFDELKFNDQHTVRNPVTNELLQPTFFHTTTQGFSVPAGTLLPSLNLSRVYLLVGSGTASANESMINGLLGIDFEVILVGETTTGKPYGFYPTDNCGTTYFSVQFQTVNAKGFGDFVTGFIPTETPSPGLAYEVQGCPVGDDYTNELGEPDESRLATALGLIDNLDCTAATPVVVAPRILSGSVPATQPGPLSLNPPPDWPGAILREER